MDKVERVFRRLKAEGKIKIAKDIAMKKWVPNFKAGIFKKMKYNARMNGLSEEDIEFCLLHEEGHFKCPVKKREWFYLVISSLLFYLFTSFFPSSGVIAMFLFLLYIRVWAFEFYQKYEYFADEFAAKNVPNPSERISALNRIPKNQNKWLYYILITVGVEYLHPTIEERKNRIKDKFPRNEVGS